MKEKNPVPTFTYLISEIRARFPNFGYIHVVEARIKGNVDIDAPEHESLDFALNAWGNRPFIIAGGYNRETALKRVQEHDNVIVAFGRWFISNVRHGHSFPPIFLFL
jgi:NADPH2 dehydrogenase